MGTRYIPNLECESLRVKGAISFSSVTLDGLKIEDYQDAGAGPELRWVYGHGTKESPEPTESGDLIGYFRFFGHESGAAPYPVGWFQAEQIGAAQSSWLQGILSLYAAGASPGNYDFLELGGGQLRTASDLAHQGERAGFFGTEPSEKPVITGWDEKTDSQKIDALKDALVALGLIATDEEEGS